MPSPEKTDAEKLADARADVVAAQERLRAVQETEASIIAAAAEVAKEIQLPHAEAFVDLMTGREAKTFRDLLEAYVAGSLDDIPKPIGISGTEGCKQKAERILASMRGGLDGAQTRVASLQPMPQPESSTPAPVTPAEA